jgi:hypothetical protein
VAIPPGLARLCSFRAGPLPATVAQPAFTGLTSKPASRKPLYAGET